MMDTEIDLPRIRLTDEQQDPHSRRVRSIYGLDRVEMSDEKWRTLRRGYYSNVSYIDDKVGELLNALEVAGLAENTIVLFTSDHGEMLGERNLIQKKTFFEDSVRVPLLIKRPDGQTAGQRHANLVSLVDLLPTLVDLADQEKKMALLPPLDGSSLAPLLFNQPLARENVVYSENTSESVTAPHLMVRRDQWKLIWCSTDPTLLYNLETDPDELENLAGRPEAAEIEAALIAELHRTWNVEQLHQEVLASQKRRALISSALQQGSYANWQGEFAPIRPIWLYTE